MGELVSAGPLVHQGAKAGLYFKRIHSGVQLSCSSPEKCCPSSMNQCTILVEPVNDVRLHHKFFHGRGKVRVCMGPSDGFGWAPILLLGGVINC
jgi:hypothetical protein